MSAPRRRRATDLATCAAAAGVALLLYANALPNAFVGDDTVMILKNRTVLQPSRAGLARLWTTDYVHGIAPDGRTVALFQTATAYRPVTTFSYWLSAATGGIVPWRFRLANIALHATAAALVALWWSRAADPLAGALAGVVVLLHPIATDVVNRIVGRADVLGVVGVAGFLTTQQAAQRAAWTWTRAALALLCAVVALGAKESGAVVVPLALLQAWVGRRTAVSEESTRVAIPQGRTTAQSAGPDGSATCVAQGGAGDRMSASRFGAGAERSGGRPGEPPSRHLPAARHAWRGALALALAGGAYLLGRALAGGVLAECPRTAWDMLECPLAAKPLADRGAAAGALAWHYFRVFAWPWPLLNIDFPARLPRWSDPVVWLGLTTTAVMAAATLWLAARRRSLAVASAWWLLGLPIIVQVLFPIGPYREARLAYPLLPGLACLAGSALAAGLRARPRAVRLATATVAALAAVVFASGVVRRNPEWRTNLTVVEADVRARPDTPMPHLALADQHEMANRNADAERELLRATELGPDFYQPWYQLGGFYERTGRTAEARRAFERAAAVAPTLPFAPLSIGILALNAGDLDGAATWLGRAEALDPAEPFVQYNLAVVDSQRGRTADAIARLERLVRARPDFGRAVDGLAKLRGTRGSAARGNQAR